MKAILRASKHLHLHAWRRRLQALLLGIVVTISLPALAGGPAATLYKDPDCGCCNEYADYLRAHGFSVKVVPTRDLARIEQQNGVPEGLVGCHTMRIGDYVFEGHVPVDSIQRVLAQRPRIKGLSVPGMPSGSPGMSGQPEPFSVYAFDVSAPPRLYATY
jgi:hypothetical protein